MSDTMISRRGTSNADVRGSTMDRRVRRSWIMTTFASDVAGYCRCWRCGHLLYNPDARPDDIPSHSPTPLPLTIDRILAGCMGGRYRRDNIRPSCAPCNIATGGYTQASLREDQEEAWKS